MKAEENKMKRFVHYLLTIVLLLSALSLHGCGGGNESRIITRGEWIKNLANVFGLTETMNPDPVYSDIIEDSEFFQVVQACAEWDILEGGEKFNPNENADVNFAIVTAVKAIGLDRIEKSVDGEKLETEDDIIDYFDDHCDVSYLSGSNLYEDTANEILTEINELYGSMELKQFQDVAYQDKVKTVTEEDIKFSADGETATILKGNFNVGDIVIIEPSQTYPEGKYAKLTSKNDKTFHYEQPALEEIFEHITMYGSYEPEIVGVVPMSDDVQIEFNDADEQSYQDEDMQIESLSTNDYVIPTKSYKIKDLNLTMNAGGDNANITGNLSLKNIKATVDLDIKPSWKGLDIKRAEVLVSDTVAAGLTVNVSEKSSFNKSFPAAKVTATLWGAITVNMDMAVKVGFDGEASIVWSIDTKEGITYASGKTPKFVSQGSNSGIDAEIHAKANFNPSVKGTLKIAGFSVANVGAVTGLNASADGKASTREEINCTDVQAYVPLSLFVNQNDSILGKMKLGKTWTIWSAGSSPFQKSWHIENNQVVPECTKGDEKEEDETKADEEANDINTTEKMDEELLKLMSEMDEHLIISSFFANVDEGKSDTVKVTRLPKDYDASKIVYTSNDTSIATVNQQGVITGVKQGTTVVKIATSDGKYAQYCTVKVSASYNVDFTPLHVKQNETLDQVFM